MSLQFLDLTPPYSNRDRAKVVMVPVPFDATTCYKAGARHGPMHILAASPHMEFYEEEVGTEVYRCGIHTIAPLEPRISPEAMAGDVEREVLQILREQKLPVVLGGEHSVSIGAIKAAASSKGPLDIIQFDAHTDLRDEYQGSPYSHACVMRRVWDLGDVIQIGIRSISREEVDFLDRKGKKPIWARDILKDPNGTKERILSRLNGRPVYITIDLDCLDPGIMPSVGTPEPGGLLWHHLTGLLKAITACGNVIGFDVVELSPIPGLHAPDYLAARLVYKLLGYIVKGAQAPTC